MKRRLAALVVGAVAVAGTPVVGGAPVAPASAVAKSCGSSYTHAVIRGAEKCLRRGQFCARAADRQYRRYGLRCTKRDYTGRYHLT
jgi:uncharacterized protein (DUF697 family)